MFKNIIQIENCLLQVECKRGSISRSKFSNIASIYSWLSLSRTRLTRISGWVKFLSRSRTSLCINIYNLTPVESNSDESKFWLSRIKVLVPRCRKPYYLHSSSQIYLSKHVYYLGIKIGSQVKHPVIDWHFYLRLFHMFISQSVKLIIFELACYYDTG